MMLEKREKNGVTVLIIFQEGQIYPTPKILCVDQYKT